MKTVIFLLVICALGAGGSYYYMEYVSPESEPTFRLVAIKRGEILWTIGASGTVQPEEVVDVGAQVAGKVNSFGPDPRGQTDPRFKGKSIDYGSPVHVGTLLTKIDDATYKAVRDQAAAALERAVADLRQAQARSTQAKADFDRAERLRAIAVKNQGESRVGGKPTAPIIAISGTDYDLAKANRDVADANVAVFEAAVKQSKAALDLAETNLAYTVITSPTEGVIIERRVNIGQTVVAALNAPSMFLIAKDLSKMQVWSQVNEADIGRIRSEMPVRFTVDAFPGEVFHGKVEQVRLNAQMTQNIVLFTVVVTFDNSKRKILPYLTANVQFEVEEHRNVLLVPTGALRWRPRPQLIAPDIRETVVAVLASKAGAKGGESGVAKHPEKEDSKAADKGTGKRGESEVKSAGEPRADRPAKEREDQGRLWVQDGEFVRPIEVQVVASDGSMTEVSGPEIREDLEVVLGEMRKESSENGDATNPFAPKLFGKKKSS
jgi:HlyD family secretion protein